MRRMPNEAMYDKFAEEYAAHAADGAYNALYDRPAMLALAGDVGGRTVLDAACGPGLYVEELVRRGAHVVGFDLSSTLIELARRRVGPAADLRVHDLTEPLSWVGDASIDLVVCALALNYVVDRVTTLREFRRVVAPDGALIVSTTHPTSDWLRLGGSYFTIEPVEGSLSPRHNWPVRAWRLPLAAVCDEFHRAGFVIVQLVEPRPRPEMAQRYPEDYTRLEHAPAFIAFRLAPALPTAR
jgi:ubiquinone/menaquinone biosynthesis C-methylase UbiE